jgi:hypothetical protein
MSFEEIESLSLLAHKVGPCVFDLSSYQTNVSIRDQIVRAQQLVIDLKVAHSAARSLLVVGMGAAGVNAALTACEVGFDDVRIVDIEDRPFQLFHRTTSRFVGPYMYEWPSQFYAGQSYPSHFSTPWDDFGRSPLNWEAKSPVSASDLAKLLEQSVLRWCEKRSSQPRPTFIVDVDRRNIRAFIKRFAAREAAMAKDMMFGPPDFVAKRSIKAFGPKAKVWEGTVAGNSVTSFKPDYIIVAAGMGKECLSIPGMREPSQSFWADDTLKEPAVADQRVIVLGGGDGAIQDVLRALTIHDHPITFIEQLEALPVVRQALENEIPALLSADRQLRQHTSWSRDSAAFAMIDTACKEAAQNLAEIGVVSRQVLRSLRKGTGEVRHYVRGPHFDKAYLLNRFVVYLLQACLRADSKENDGGMGFTLVFNKEVKYCVYPKKNRMCDLYIGIPGVELPHGLTKIKDVDHLIVRFGILKDTIPGPLLIQISDAVTKQRTTLNRVELPFVVMNNAAQTVSNTVAPYTTTAA